LYSIIRNNGNYREEPEAKGFKLLPNRSIKWHDTVSEKCPEPEERNQKARGFINLNLYVWLFQM
jgi:hypothetical protein